MRQSLKLEPKDINTAWMVEWINLCLNRPAPALEDRLLELAVSDEDTYVAKVCHGVACFLQHKYDEANTWFEQAYPIEPDEWDAWFWQGLNLAYQEKPVEAAQMLEKALEKKLPVGLLAPLKWLEQDKPELYSHLSHFLNL